MRHFNFSLVKLKLIASLHHVISVTANIENIENIFKEHNNNFCCRSCSISGEYVIAGFNCNLKVVGVNLMEVRELDLSNKT